MATRLKQPLAWFLLLFLTAWHLALSPSPASSAPPSPEEAYSLPTQHEVIRAFDNPKQPWLSGHRGVDFTSQVGATITAAKGGTIAFAGVVVDRPLVSIEHPDGIRTTYEPVQTSLTTGQLVHTGEPIGTLTEGNGHCPQPCLHWGARIGTDTYIDPLSLITGWKIRLYPPEPW